MRKLYNSTFVGVTLVINIVMHGINNVKVVCISAIRIRHTQWNGKYAKCMWWFLLVRFNKRL